MGVKRGECGQQQNELGQESKEKWCCSFSLIGQLFILSTQSNIGAFKFKSLN